MSAASLRHFLESLCFKSPWNYAVFWKLQHQCPIILTWEDGYLDVPGAREPYRSQNGNYYSKNLSDLSPNCGSRSHNGYLSAHSIGLAVAEMSSTYHIAGKGVVGEVASLGIPRWISSDSVAPAELGFGSVAECPDKWMLQFVAGIKTILLVPCIPYGVLQLGSVETVAENMEMVTILAEEFDAHLKFVESFLPGGESCEFLLQSTLSETLNIPSATTTNKVNEDDVAADIPIVEDHKSSAVFPMTSLIDVQHPFQLSGQHMQNVLENENGSKIGKFVEHMPNVLENAYKWEIPMQHVDMINLVKQLAHGYSDDNRSGITERSIVRSSCHTKDIDAFSYSSCNVGGVGVSNEVDFHFDGDMLDPRSLGMDCHNTILGNVSNSFSCSTERELYEAFGSTIHNLSGFSANPSSKSIYAADCTFNSEPSDGWHLKEDNAENLLEAVVASAYCFTDDYSLNKMAGLESLNMSSGKPVPSRKRLNQSAESDSVGDAVTRSTLTSASAGVDKYAFSFLRRPQMVGFQNLRLAHRLTGYVSRSTCELLLKIGCRGYCTEISNRVRNLFPLNYISAPLACIPRTSYTDLLRYSSTQGLRHEQFCTTAGNEEMQKISVTFVDKDGEENHIKVPVGMSMLEAAHENDIELEGACEASLACSTCHVIVMDMEYYNKLEDPTDEENDMLDLAFALTDTSRLGCQVIAKPELDGIRLALPVATRNFAVDGYKPKPH